MQFSFEGLECETSTIIILGGKERRGFSVTLWERLGAPIRGYSGEWEGGLESRQEEGEGHILPGNRSSEMSDAACSRGGAPPTKRLVFFIRICSGCGGARNRNQELSLVRLGEPVKNYLAGFFR